jgi:orotate phosphoribosyltransferase
MYKMATAGVPSGTILAVHLKEMFAFIKPEGKQHPKGEQL